MYSATICNYSEIDTDDIMKGCKGTEECLCIKEEFCLLQGEEMKPFGMNKEGVKATRRKSGCQRRRPCVGGAGEPTFGLPKGTNTGHCRNWGPDMGCR